MRRYKPWQLVLGYIIGLAVLIGGLVLAIYAVAIVHAIWFFIYRADFLGVELHILRALAK